MNSFGIFEGYYTIFEAKELTGKNNSFSTEAFKDNPLIGIQHDGDLSKIEDLGTLGAIEISTENEFKTIAKFKKDGGEEVSKLADEVKKIKDSDLVIFNEKVKSPVELNKIGEVKVDKEGKKIETAFNDFKKNDEIKAGKYFIITYNKGKNNDKTKIEFKIVKEDSKFGDDGKIEKKTN